MQWAYYVIINMRVMLEYAYERMKIMQKSKKTGWIFVLLLGALFLFYTLLYYADNKYHMPPPYGNNGIILLNENDLAQNKPIFLIDGWLLSDEHANGLPTYIGEYANLQRNDPMLSPHGKAAYQLTLQYSGKPILVAVRFPKLSTEYIITLNHQQLTSGTGSGLVFFQLRQGSQTLTVQTVSRNGYYSGMYFPPVLATPEVLSAMQEIRTAAYTLAFGIPLALALYTIVIWRRGKEAVLLWFGLFCCFVSLYVSYYFVDLYQPAWSSYWQILEGTSLYGLFFCVVQLTALAADEVKKRSFWQIQKLFIVFPVCLAVLYFLIPVIPWAVRFHGILKDIYFIFTFSCVIFLSIRAALHHSFEYLYILVGNVVFGFGLLFNLFFSNIFEPILFFWQFEWSGLFLVLLFSVMMAERNRRIITENDQLHNHMEQMVIKRTEELHLLLQERKAFFADMAHDLKAPLYSTQAYIKEIRQNNTGVDKELLRYIDYVEQKQNEMSRRVHGLNVLSRLDKIEAKLERISVKTLLQDIYNAHVGMAEVSRIYLMVEEIVEECFIFAQVEKLEMVFENLFFNALQATPPEGSITISARKNTNTVKITVSDTGFGISENELPHIFQRFYVGERNKANGSGLGLYIVKSIIEELGGNIHVTSIVGQGTSFSMEIPLS